MKTTKLVLGIISCVLILIVLFQSCAAGIYESLQNSSGASGAVGILFAILLLAAGIIAIATHNTIAGGGTIASVILYALGGIMAVAGHGVYEDLIVWGTISLIFAVIFIIFFISAKKKANYNR